MAYGVSTTKLQAGLPTVAESTAFSRGWAAPILRTVDTDRKGRLGYAIRRAREARGLTPPQLADALHKSRGTVNDWESGASAPSLLDLGPLCDALGVDPRLFADLPPEPASPVDAYLVEATAVQAIQEGVRRAKTRRADRE